MEVFKLFGTISLETGKLKQDMRTAKADVGSGFFDWERRLRHLRWLLITGGFAWFARRAGRAIADMFREGAKYSPELEQSIGRIGTAISRLKASAAISLAQGLGLKNIGEQAAAVTKELGTWAKFWQRTGQMPSLMWQRTRRFTALGWGAGVGLPMKTAGIGARTMLLSLLPELSRESPAMGAMRGFFDAHARLTEDMWQDAGQKIEKMYQQEVPKGAVFPRLQEKFQTLPVTAGLPRPTDAELRELQQIRQRLESIDMQIGRKMGATLE